MNREKLDRKIEEVFPGAYFTVLSIVQGVAFGFLFYNAAHVLGNTQWNSFFDWLVPFQILLSFLIIVTIWYEYSYFPIFWSWFLSPLDAIVPFLLGATEIAPTYFFRRPFAWMIAIFGLGLAGAFAYYNTMVHTTLSDFIGDESDQRGQAIYKAIKTSLRRNAYRTLSGSVIAAIMCLSFSLGGPFVQYITFSFAVAYFLGLVALILYEGARLIGEVDSLCE